MGMRLIQVTVSLADAGSVYEVLCRMPEVYGLHMFRGDTAALLQFRARQKKTGGILQVLDTMGLMQQSRDQQGQRFAAVHVDVLNLCVTKPRLLTLPPANSSTSIRERMALEEIYETVDSGVHLHFDFMALTAIAALIASVGMLSDSSVVVVASMLLSPLMGPILGMTLAVLVQDSNLLKKSLKTEAVGFGLTLFVGLMAGLFAVPFGRPTTFEMISRSTPNALLFGLLVAIPSGAGLAISVSNGGVNSLVGVAIAATVLPPIANAGINFVYGFFASDSANAKLHFGFAFFSLFLFLVNLLVIFGSALIIFKLKKCSPLGKAQHSRFLSCTKGISVISVAE